MNGGTEAKEKVKGTAGVVGGEVGRAGLGINAPRLPTKMRLSLTMAGSLFQGEDEPDLDNAPASAVSFGTGRTTRILSSPPRRDGGPLQSCSRSTASLGRDGANDPV